jgi:DNA primase
MLLEESSNRVEYQLNAIRRKYDLSIDDQKIRYVHEAADLICTLDSSIKREVYGGRVAESAGISLEAMKLEIGKAYKRRTNAEKKKQEKIDLEPMRKLQPKERSIRYDNMKSARAEEVVIAQIIREPALLDVCKSLKQEQFSVDVLGRVFAQLQKRHSQGMEVSLGVLEDITPEEASHLAGICQSQSGPVNEDALRDCIKTIVNEAQNSRVSSDDDLMSLRNRMKESKGINT